MIKGYLFRNFLVGFLSLGLWFFLELGASVEASFQAKLEIPLSENKLLVGYVFAPDGLESQGANIISTLEEVFHANVQVIDYDELVNELNRLFNRDLYYPEVYGLVVTSACGGSLYRLAFYENGNFIEYRYLQEANFCDSGETLSLEVVRGLLEKTETKI